MQTHPLMRLTRKNDRLSHIMATLPSTTQVKSVYRIDIEEYHGWKINSVQKRDN
jgi:hypothetical protein